MRSRTRLREISIDRLERIKDGLSMSWKEIAEFLGVKTPQLTRYRATACLPADRFYAFQNALLLNVEEKAAKERQYILSLFQE